MHIAIIGTGYVGLVTGTCLSDFGLQVTCVDQDKTKIALLSSGGVPIYEPNLESLIQKNVSDGRLTFTTDLERAIKESKIIFIAVGTPANEDGSVNLKQIKEVTQQIAYYLNDYKIIVIKSTVPIGTARRIKEIIAKNQPPLSLRATKERVTIPPSVIPAEEGIHPSVIVRREAIKQSHTSSHWEGVQQPKQSQFQAVPFDIIANPEFLREGSAVHDFTHPDKIVIGYESENARQIMREVYRPLYLLDTPFVFTTLETAELIKYACNALLATKITFINEIANLCDKVGADVHEVAKAMGLDGRIGPKFLHPGPGYGGSCFPKDTKALCSIAENYGYDFKTLKAVILANQRQRELMIDKIKHHIGEIRGKTIGVLGLAFKQNTDDIRESPALDIIQILIKEGAQIRCFDPLAMENTNKILPGLIYCQDEYDTARNSHILIILTEWNQFRSLDLAKIKKLLKSPILIDLRNLYEPTQVKELGIIYEGVGRK